MQWLNLVPVRLRRKVGRDGFGTFAAFQMLLAKIGEATEVASLCDGSEIFFSFVALPSGQKYY